MAGSLNIDLGWSVVVWNAIVDLRKKSKNK